MKKRIISLLLALIFCLGCFTACSSEEKPAEDTTKAPDVTEPTESIIYVDASAADSGDGSENAPFKTIADAQAKIREMKADGLPDGGVTVLLADGNYEPIAFTADDSGSEKSPIKYAAKEIGRVTFNPGITLSASDFEALSEDEKANLIEDDAKENVKKVDLKKFGVTTEDLGILSNSAEIFINTDRLTVSRYPNEGNIKTGETDGEFVIGITEEVKARAEKWGTKDIWADGYFYHEWSHDTLPISDIDLGELKITLGEKHYYGIRKNRPYYVLNIYAETDMPGEYYIDRENAVLYLYPTEDFDNATITFSASGSDIININNASYLSFEGLNLNTSKSNGFYIIGSNINISDCEIYDIRGTAIFAVGENIKINNNEIYQIGAHAIELYGGNEKTLTPSGNLVHNNHIHHWAQLERTYRCAVYLEGCGTTISHNEMHDAPHEAIEYSGPNHIMEYNEIYRVCTETGDCGAFYTGRKFYDYGCIIRYNFIHDIGTNGLRADGIFLDDGESGQTLIGNLIVKVSGHGINIGGGRDNVVENNLILDWNYKKNKALLFDNRGRDYMLYDDPDQAQWMADTLKEYQAQQEWLDAFPGYGDIIPFYVGYEGDVEDPMLSGNPSNNVFRNNMFYKMKQTFLAGDNDPNVSYRLIMNMDNYNNFVENCLSLQDYEFVDFPGYENGDYTLAENSKAYQNGFEKLPFDQMGRIIEE